MSDVAIIDYGMGNLRSVAKAVEHVAPGKTVVVTSDPSVVAAAGRVVFPGQGAMPDCMRELELRGLRRAVLAAAASKPFLGICIGQQMLFGHSEEGDVPGLGILPGKVIRFPDAKMVAADGSRLKVPHMGWNGVQQHVPHPLWEGIPDGERFYFVHSYFVQPDEQSLVAAETAYGLMFTSAVARDNIFAVQFHPEKSAQAGLRMLANFISWAP
ncbi:imidazole glycerol phosphate synthase subunit HisH [Aromatoleum toluvorans]|uniref:Imidazole glycerol phosphate synthase subunit HisH n=1 Tax=Aromatoleum toluvorans TaxID=92002 RepID=A0ABX1PVR9_9RHOO|nr:imidazole glycerol phosphate synthase subunit HisH [Aromatoleum toluvorans]NMG43531.1 imidazole glycerol phosphate synthase subunit HisH [Aromatoleum toluvorans]